MLKIWKVSIGVTQLEEFGRIYDIRGKMVAEGKGKISLRRGIYFIRTGGRTYKVILM